MTRIDRWVRGVIRAEPKGIEGGFNYRGKGEPSRMCAAQRGLVRLDARVRRALGHETLAELVGPVCSQERTPVSTDP